MAAICLWHLKHRQIVLAEAHISHRVIVFVFYGKNEIYSYSIWISTSGFTSKPKLILTFQDSCDQCLMPINIDKSHGTHPNVYQFRSMPINADANKFQIKANDFDLHWSSLIKGIYIFLRDTTFFTMWNWCDYFDSFHSRHYIEQ